MLFYQIYINFQWFLQEYLSRHRTQCIDVDSGGRKCKERMMTVVAELEFPIMADKFIVKDLESSEELKNLFTEIGLKELYESHVKHLSK